MILIAAAIGLVGLVARTMPTRWTARPARRRLATISTPGRPARGPSRFEGWLAPRLEAADLDWPAAMAARHLRLGAAASLVVGGALGGPVLAVSSVATLALGVPVGLASASGRRDSRLERELPALLEAVARSLRSGAAIPVALGEAAGTGSAAAQDLSLVLRDVDRGLPFEVALEGWVRRRPLAGVRLAVGALAVALVSGGAPARAVDGVAATLRERAEVDREARSLATQARTSAVVVTLAPLAFGALGVLGDERTARFLLHTTAGWTCIAIGLSLDALGAWWMSRIARRPS